MKLVDILTYSQLLYLLLIIHYYATCKNLLQKKKLFLHGLAKVLRNLQFRQIIRIYDFYYVI